MRKKVFMILALVPAALFSSCFITDYIDSFLKGIKTGKELKDADYAYLKKIGMYEKGETIIMFSSNNSLKNAGSFFTDAKAASYWIDENHPERTSFDKARYNDIADIKVDYSTSWDAATKITIVTGKGKFDMFISGDRDAERLFYNQLIKIWKTRKRVP